ncbi:MAG: hypothetical protein GX660_16355 [Clostridiaceae bacterium]|nr:hypothetical protein [Clostridiaceae bacterium]
MKQKDKSKQLNIKKTSANTKYYYLFIALILLSAISLLIFSYIKLSEVSAKVSGQRALLNRYSEEEAKISGLLDEFGLIKDQSLKLTNAIPDKVNLVDFIENIEQIGLMIGMKVDVRLKEGVVDDDGVIVDVVSDATKKITSYSGITDVEVLEVGVTSRISPSEFSKVINFINLLSDLKYYSKIVDMKFISGLDESGGGEYLDCIFTLNLYVKEGGVAK